MFGFKFILVTLYFIVTSLTTHVHVTSIDKTNGTGTVTTNETGIETTDATVITTGKVIETTYVETALETGTYYLNSFNSINNSV